MPVSEPRGLGYHAHTSYRLLFSLLQQNIPQKPLKEGLISAHSLDAGAPSLPNAVTW